MLVLIAAAALFLAAFIFMPPTDRLAGLYSIIPQWAWVAFWST
jgi:hypothetical protein